MTYAVLLGSVVAFSYTIFAFIGRLQRRIIDQNRQLSTLNSVAATAAEKLRLEELLGTGLDKVMDAMSADAGLIYLVDLDRKELSAVCVRGFPAEISQKFSKSSSGTIPWHRR